MRKWIAAVAGAITLAWWCGVSGQSVDEARSQLPAARAVAVGFTIKVEEHQWFIKKVREQFGSGVKMVFNPSNGQTEIMLGNKVVAAQVTKARIDEVVGVFRVGSAYFPFALTVDEAWERPDDVDNVVRWYLEKEAPQLLGYKNFEWSTLWCRSQAAPDMGVKFSDAPARLGIVDLCMVQWRAGSPKTMLIGGVAADGGAWVRDATRPICRNLASHWIGMLGREIADHRIDYVGCVLVHDPAHGPLGARNTVVEHLYELRQDHNLALID